MRARGANIQHAATKVTNGEDCASMVRQFVNSLRGSSVYQFGTWNDGSSVCQL